MFPILIFTYFSLTSKITTIAHSVDAKIGATVVLIETGDRVSFHGNQHYPMQSVYKLPISWAVLRDIDRHKLTLDQTITVTPKDYLPKPTHSPLRDNQPNGGKVTIKELIRLTIEESDGSASDVLMRLAGGAPAIDKFIRSLGVNGVKIKTTEQLMQTDPMVQYRNWATPDSMCKLLCKLQKNSGLTKSSHDLLVKDMIESVPGEHRLKGLLPKDAVVAHKTGTDGTHNGLTRATNDVGIITLPNGRHLAITVFVSDSHAGEKEREGVIAKIAKAAWDHFSTGKLRP